MANKVAEYDPDWTNLLSNGAHIRDMVNVPTTTNDLEWAAQQAWDAVKAESISNLGEDLPFRKTVLSNARVRSTKY